MFFFAQRVPILFAFLNVYYPLSYLIYYWCLACKIEEAQDNRNTDRDSKSNKCRRFLIEVFVSGSIQSDRDIVYYIKYIENLTKSQLTKEVVISPQEILYAFKKILFRPHIFQML